MGWTDVQGQDQPQSKFEANLGHMTLSQSSAPDNQQVRVSINCLRMPICYEVREEKDIAQSVSASYVCLVLILLSSCLNCDSLKRQLIGALSFKSILIKKRK